jgi:flagellar hook protein FlgE
MSFETALTGLNAAAADLDVTGNNIANSATVGFKYSRAEFADIFASSNLGVSQNAVGQGVRLANVSQQFAQGQFEFTGNTLDLAVNGTGFFRVSDQGAISYTRNGAFQLDRDGYIIDASGRRLTGFQATAAGTVGGALGELQVNVGNVAPEASTEIGLSANLDSRADVIDRATTPFDAADPASYGFSTSTTVYDSQGRDYLSTLYFTKTATNEWEVVVDGGGSDGPEAARTITFNPDGSYAAVDDASAFDFTFPGADPASVTVDFSALTQYGSVFDVKELSQDGFPAGQFAGLSVEGDGRILARFTNGRSQVLGQVALARFPNAQKLQEVGDTAWIETFASGTPLTAAPGTSGMGTLEGGALEQSNVNLTEQLVQMITAQRNYQANSQMISTQDQITQEILNIR